MVTNSAPPWIKREVSLGNVLLLLGMLGSVGAGIWEGAAIRTTLADGIDLERAIRENEIKSINSQLANTAAQLDGMRLDIRELRNVTMAWLSEPARRGK